MHGGRDAATVAREELAARVATGDGWALFALMRLGRRGRTRRALAEAARRGLVIMPAHLDRVARAIRATWPRDDRGDRACAAARPDDDEDDEYLPRPRLRDVLAVVDLAPPWTDLTAGERAALLVAVATATPGRRTA